MMTIPPEELETCLRVLQQIADDPAMMNEHERFKGLIAKIHRVGKKGARNEERQQRSEADLQSRARTGLMQTRFAPEEALPPEAEMAPRRLHRAIRCYICKQSYTDLHCFYHLLCPVCAAFNYRKRTQTADLTGRRALVTGGRVKIGYRTALHLLRNGAQVMVTTRFPADAAQRFAAEEDLCHWQERLRIVGLDLRFVPAVEAFARHLVETEPSLDILIHNAAQTITRPPAYYQPLQEREQQAHTLLSTRAHSLLSDWRAVFPPMLAGEKRDSLQAYFPAEQRDDEGQPLDLRPKTSWTLRLDEVETSEMLETHLVNAVAPFILNSRLKPLLLRSPFPRRFIVNVSAMEGQFQRESKTEFHPHTNMAKAALNMMTRTSAQDYARDGIYMNSVDTGWITDENPFPKKMHIQERQGFFTPLDITDGMARILDPIFQGVTDPAEPLSGHFLKDYVPHPW